MGKRLGYFILLSILGILPSASAQQLVLQEKIEPGECFQYDISLHVDGKMKVDRDGRADLIPLAARAQHQFIERVEAVEARGGIGKAIRIYSTASSASDIAGERNTRQLNANRKLIIAQRSEEGALHFCPEGPLTREELELVAEHFDTLVIPALLPSQPVKVKETWKLNAEVVQHVCHFEGLINSSITGELQEMSETIARIRIFGNAEGVEHGAVNKVTVSGLLEFDRQAKRITSLTWEQSDDRAQGPVSPASEVKAIVKLKRANIGREPKELDAETIAKAQLDIKQSPVLKQLRYTDGQGRYHLLHSRAWHTVGRTGDHVVMRLVDQGEFVAQATIMAWKSAAPGQHATPEELKQAIDKIPGWKPEAIIVDRQEATDPGRWLYRISARGQQDQQAVVNHFYLLAGPQGDQVVVTVVCRPELQSKLAARDLALVNAIEFQLRK